MRASTKLGVALLVAVLIFGAVIGALGASGAFDGSTPVVALRSPVRYRVGALSFSIRFPGTPSVRSYGSSGPYTSQRIEWDWRSPGPNGGNREFVDVYPTTRPLSIATARQLLRARGYPAPNGATTAGYPIYTQVQPCELDDNMGACGFSARIYSFGRHAMYVVSVSGPSFSEAVVRAIVQSFRTGASGIP